MLKENIAKAASKIDSNVVGSNEGLIVPHRESSNAAHISIMDRDGHVVSISQTINKFFGSAISLEKYGILFNNAMNNFSRDSSSSNALKPGRRPQSTLAPTILLRDNKTFLVIGASGAERIIPTLAQVIINLIDFELSLLEAIQAPRFHYNYNTDTIEMESRIESNSIDYLKQLGHKIKLMNDFDVYFGNVQAVLNDPINSKAVNVSDVRKEEVVYILNK